PGHRQEAPHERPGPTNVNSIQQVATGKRPLTNGHGQSRPSRPHGRRASRRLPDQPEQGSTCGPTHSQNAPPTSPNVHGTTCQTKALERQLPNPRPISSLNQKAPVT